MSRNLYKSNRVVVQENSKCIDNNRRVAMMLEHLTQKVEHGEGKTDAEANAEFVGGFPGEDGLETLLVDPEQGETGNVIKAQVGPTPEELRKQAEEVLEQAKEEARTHKEEVLNQARIEAVEIRKQAEQEGLQRGLQEADAQLQAQREQLAVQKQELEALYQQKMEEMEPAMVEVLTDIYEHIFKVELNQYRQILIQLISSTMRKVEEKRHFLVHVAKEDYAFVSMNKRALQESGGNGRVDVEIVEDITLSRNQCMLETENGIFDCGLDTQLDELNRKLRLLSYERKSE